jgi:hypothetical protein
VSSSKCDCTKEVLCTWVHKVHHNSLPCHLPHLLLQHNKWLVNIDKAQTFPGNLTQEKVWYVSNFVILHFGFGITSHLLMKLVFSISLLFWNQNIFYGTNNLALYCCPQLDKYNGRNDRTPRCVIQDATRQSPPFENS